MINRFILNEVSYFGAGARKQLPEVLARLNLHKALVATDKGLLKVGTAKMVTDVLDEAGFAYDIYSEIKPNPTVTNVKQGVDAFKASGADLIIAPRYEVSEESYVIFKKVSVTVKGNKGNIRSIR